MVFKSERPLNLLILSLFFAFVLAVAGCSGGGGGSSSGGEVDIRGNADNVVDIIEVARVEMETYTDVLAIFSEDGTKPLFDATVDYDETDWLMLGDVANRMVAAEELLDAALPNVLEKSGGRTGERKISLFGWVGPVYNFLSAGSRFQENVRIISSKVMTGLSTTDKVGIYTTMQEMKEDASLPDSVDIGSNFATFYEKLNNGELDDYITRIHSRMYHDQSGYGDTCSTNNITIGRTISTEGMKLLEAGASLYLHGVGQISPDLANGINKAIDLNDKLKSKDTLDFIKKSSKGTIKARIHDKITSLDPENKYLDFVSGEVSGELTDAVEESIAKGVQVFTQQTDRMKVERDVADDPSVESKDKAKEAWNQIKAADAARDAEEDAWGFGAVVASVADGVASAGNLLVRWVDSETGEARLMLSLDAPQDGAPMPIPAEEGDVEVIALNDGTTAATSTGQEETVLEPTPGEVCGLEVNPDDPPAEQAAAILTLTATNLTPATDEEVTITGQISPVLFPPFDVVVTVTGSATAILVSDSTSDDRTIAAEFSTTNEGNYSYTYTVTDAFGNTASADISLVASDTPVDPPAVTTATYQSNGNAFTTDPGTADAISWVINVTLTTNSDGTLTGTLTGTGNGYDITDSAFSGTWIAGVDFIAQGWFDIGGDRITFSYSATIANFGQQTISGSINGGGETLFNFSASKI